MMTQASDAAWISNLVVCSLTMKHTRVVSTKCTPGFACRAFSDTTLVCFIVNEHTTKCSHYIITHAPVHINDFRGVRARYVKRTG